MKKKQFDPSNQAEQPHSPLIFYVTYFHHVPKLFSLENAEIRNFVKRIERHNRIEEKPLHTASSYTS